MPKLNRKSVIFHMFADPRGFNEDKKIWGTVVKDTFEVFLNVTNRVDLKCVFTASDLPKFQHGESYDVLLFDWGGMSLGNSMLEHFAEHIFQLAEDNPSKYYVVISQLSAYAFKDIVERCKPENTPANLFLNNEDFFELLREGKVTF